MKKHHYQIQLRWTGNLGRGTSDYRSYSRNYELLSSNKPPILGSSDPAFRGDPARYNPEELLLSAISSCHMLWFLHLCSASGIKVVDYEDEAEGTLLETVQGDGAFSEVWLKPKIKIAAYASKSDLKALHQEANNKCFIARSCNFPIYHEASYHYE